MMNMKENMNTVICMILVLTIYSFTKNQIMSNLIIIEFIIITILMMMFKTMVLMEMENYLILYFLVTAICESMLGLSTMIAMIRTHNSSQIKTLSMMKF